MPNDDEGWRQALEAVARLRAMQQASFIYTAPDTMRVQARLQPFTPLESARAQLADLEDERHEVQTILVQVCARRSWMEARCLRVLQAAVQPC